MWTLLTAIALAAPPTPGGEVRRSTAPVAVGSASRLPMGGAAPRASRGLMESSDRAGQTRVVDPTTSRMGHVSMVPVADELSGGLSLGDRVMATVRGTGATLPWREDRDKAGRTIVVIPIAWQREVGAGGSCDPGVRSRLSRSKGSSTLYGFGARDLGSDMARAGIWASALTGPGVEVRAAQGGAGWGSRGAGLRLTGSGRQIGDSSLPLEIALTSVGAGPGHATVELVVTDGEGCARSHHIDIVVSGSAPGVSLAVRGLAGPTHGLPATQIENSSGGRAAIRSTVDLGDLRGGAGLARDGLAGRVLTRREAGRSVLDIYYGLALHASGGEPGERCELLREGAYVSGVQPLCTDVRSSAHTSFSAEDYQPCGSITVARTTDDPEVWYVGVGWRVDLSGPVDLGAGLRGNLRVTCSGGPQLGEFSGPRHEAP